MLTTTPSAKEKSRALELALQQIEKQFGKGAIMKLGDGETPPGIEVIPTGSIGRDLALGVGGVPRGRIGATYGPESSGKTTVGRTTVVFITQILMQIGVMFGSPETTAGGRALKFYASLRLDIRRIATLKEGENAVGNRTKVKVVKNKVAAPFREAEFDILYNEGISREGELLDYAIDKGVVQKAGTWLSFGEERIGQGRENARMFLKEHPDVRAQIEAKLLPAIGLRPATPAQAPQPATAGPNRPPASPAHPPAMV